MSNLYLSDFLLLREEVHSLIDLLSQRGFALDDVSNMDFQKIRYKRLVRLYNVLDECILDLLDGSEDEPVEDLTNDTEFINKRNLYDKSFEIYFREWLKDFRSHELVEHEQILCKMIDSDLVADSLLMDEVMILFNLIRDECVKRVAKSVNVEL